VVVYKTVGVHVETTKAVPTLLKNKLPFKVQVLEKPLVPGEQKGASLNHKSHNSSTRPKGCLVQGRLIFHSSLEIHRKPSTVLPGSEWLSGNPWVSKRGRGSAAGPAVPWEV